jgi:hypothetical protein
LFTLSIIWQQHQQLHEMLEMGEETKTVSSYSCNNLL